MLDFLICDKSVNKNGTMEVFPKFRVGKPKDLMIRGGDFYAVWNEETKLWSTDEDVLIQLIDKELDIEANNLRKTNPKVAVKYMWDSDSGSITKWHTYVQRHLRDNYHPLDENLIFANTETRKEDYASKKLPYPLAKCDISNYEELISTLYTPEERAKIEWAIGAIVVGDSKNIQKFLVMYGSAGTGKSTILNIIQMLFEGYYSTFDAKSLGSINAQFALEAFKTNPLVAIQHDGDLSRIEDNTRLNSVVSHEVMTINEKNKSLYSARFNSFLFMGTNRPVKITDAKSGIIRRLIDVSPSGKKLTQTRYNEVTSHIKFELGGIAQHCKEVYLEDPHAYDTYRPLTMMGATNDFYNFVLDNYEIFVEKDGVTLTSAFAMYNEYCEAAKVGYPCSRRIFQEELKNYFEEYHLKYLDPESNLILKQYYKGFIVSKFEEKTDIPQNKKEHAKVMMELMEQHSLLDDMLQDCPAQYATEGSEVPMAPWDKVTTSLKDIDTERLHYVRVPENHIVIDFDLKNEKGEKDYERNVEEASKWPETYAETSKSGNGIHLHYIYSGDISTLSRVYSENIEIKVFTGKSALRRKLVKCNDIPIRTISGNLPTREVKKVINYDNLNNERALRALIAKGLNRQVWDATKPSVDYIYMILEEAYEAGYPYDVTDLEDAIRTFALNSTHNADYCLKKFLSMKLKSKLEVKQSFGEHKRDEIIFFDIEIFPNLFVVVWKFKGGNPVTWINPSADEISELIKFKLVGFNCRKYDNHILYARLLGYTNEQLYNLSQDIIVNKRNFFPDAYNLSYTDIYDFSSNKQSLKKFEIELGIHHQELGLPWDQPVPEEMWQLVADYCINDVVATEAVFEARQGDFVARQILVDLTKIMHGITSSVNDTTNSLSTKIIFGNNKTPQGVFNWRDLSKPVGSDQYSDYVRKFGEGYRFRVFNDEGIPEYRDYIPGETLPKGWSILPFFPKYKYHLGKSYWIFDDMLFNIPIERLTENVDYELIGEGGRVYAQRGMYANVWDGDVSSMHPHSVVFEVLFGPEFTRRFEDIVEARVAVKHKDFEKAGTLLNGALKPYLNADQASDLAQALKIVINSIYGLTSANFENAFRSKENIDNIVAKRGALFMTLLRDEVVKRGYTVAHVKTDSIKIPDATPEIMDFVCKFGLEFGYSFETEAEFSKFALVNNAVYIAKFKEPEINKKTGKEIWWTATGTQFAVPYVFKTLFSHEPITFDDLCETKSVQVGAIYLDLNEGILKDFNEQHDNCLPERYLTEYDVDKLVTAKKLKIDISEEDLAQLHDYHFIGRVGQFTPIKIGCGGALLVNNRDGKYNAVTGAKGYRWLESETIRGTEKENDVDYLYFRRLVDDAIDSLSKAAEQPTSNYTDVEAFIEK